MEARGGRFIVARVFRRVVTLSFFWAEVNWAARAASQVMESIVRAYPLKRFCIVNPPSLAYKPIDAAAQGRMQNYEPCSSLFLFQNQLVRLPTSPSRWREATRR